MYTGMGIKTGVYTIKHGGRRGLLNFLTIIFSFVTRDMKVCNNPYAVSSNKITTHCGDKLPAFLLIAQSRTLSKFAHVLVPLNTGRKRPSESVLKGKMSKLGLHIID